MVRVKTAGKLTVVCHVLCAGLEVLAVCFDKQLASEWHHVAKCIQHLALKGKGDLKKKNVLTFMIYILLLHIKVKLSVCVRTCVCVCEL